MKAIISNRIYLEVDLETEKEIKRQLTYTIETFDALQPLVIRTYSVIRSGLLSIPVGRVDLIPTNYEIKDKRVQNIVDFPEFKFPLRESQQNVYDEIDDNALINARVSWGKTFAGLAIAGKFRQKTLIVVHTKQLLHQWANEVKKVYGFEPGKIGDGNFNHNAPITIGTVQTLERRMAELAKEFGTIIMDEVHHAPSPTFTKVIDRSYARYKIGLSGTLIRKDGKHVLLNDYFGHKTFIPPKENSMTPIVHAIRTNIAFPVGDELGWAAKVTMLQESIVYRNLIINLTKKYAGMGHKVLAVSDRVDFIKNLTKATEGALIIGATKDRDVQIAKIVNGETNILGGIQSILSEGFSCEPLSCLIMCTPVNNDALLEQLIGRIIRLCDDKMQPIVVDPILEGYTVRNQFNNRLAFYRRSGLEVKFLDP